MSFWLPIGNSNRSLARCPFDFQPSPKNITGSQQVHLETLPGVIEFDFVHGATKYGSNKRHQTTRLFHPGVTIWRSLRACTSPNQAPLNEAYAPSVSASA